MLGDARLLSADGRFEAVQGAVLAAPTGGWTFRLDGAKGFSGEPPADDALLARLRDAHALRQPRTLSYTDYVNRFDVLERVLRAEDRWSRPHPWLTTFVGDSAVEAVVPAELARLDPADLGAPFGQVVLSPLLRRAVASPLLRLPADDLCFAFNLIRLPVTDSVEEIDRLVAANRATYDRVRAVGGTLYPASAAVPMSGDDWERHFGPAFAAFHRAKLAYDPDHVLTPGYEVFGRRG